MVLLIADANNYCCVLLIAVVPLALFVVGCASGGWFASLVWMLLTVLFSVMTHHAIFIVSQLTVF